MSCVCYSGLGEGFPHERLHVNIQFLHSARLLMWYSSSICTRWQTCEPGFPHGRSPRLAVCTEQWRALFLNIYLCCAFSLPLSLSLSLSFTQFKCCGWNNYTDWSWNLYFNCTHTNPSSERCSVPYSCCTPVPGEVCSFCFDMKTHMQRTNIITM